MTDIIKNYNHNPDYVSWMENKYNLTPELAYEYVNLHLLQEYLREVHEVISWVKPCDVEFNDAFYPKIDTKQALRHSFKPKSTYYDALVFSLTRAIIMLEEDYQEAYKWEN
jgi:hypothetical protein